MRFPRSPNRNGGLLIKRGREEEGLLLRARTEEMEGMRQGRKGRKREFSPKVSVSGIKTGCSGSRLTSGMVRSRTIAVYRQSYRIVTIVTVQGAGRRWLRTVRSDSAVVRHFSRLSARRNPPSVHSARRRPRRPPAPL